MEQKNISTTPDTKLEKKLLEIQSTLPTLHKTSKILFLRDEIFGVCIIP